MAFVYIHGVLIICCCFSLYLVLVLSDKIRDPFGGPGLALTLQWGVHFVEIHGESEFTEK